MALLCSGVAFQNVGSRSLRLNVAANRVSMSFSTEGPVPRDGAITKDFGPHSIDSMWDMETEKGATLSSKTSRVSKVSNFPLSFSTIAATSALLPAQACLAGSELPAVVTIGRPILDVFVNTLSVLMLAR